MCLTYERVAIGVRRRAGPGLRPALVVLSCLTFGHAVSGCDQKDPEQDAEPEDGGVPGSGEVDAAAYLDLDVRDNPYPVVDGASWVYRHRGGDTTWDEQVTLSAERFEGQDAFVLGDSEGPSGSRSVSILVQQGTAVTRVHKEVLLGERIDATVDYDPGFVRFDLAWLGVAAGFSEEREYDRVELDAMGTVARDGNRAHAFTVESLDDSVSAPIGDLDGCVRVYRERVRNVGAPTTEDDNKRFWFCPGIGKVREEDDAGKVEELVECDVPGGRCP